MKWMFLFVYCSLLALGFYYIYSGGPRGDAEATLDATTDATDPAPAETPPLLKVVAVRDLSQSRKLSADDLQAELSEPAYASRDIEGGEPVTEGDLTASPPSPDADATLPLAFPYAPEQDDAVSVKPGERAHVCRDGAVLASGEIREALCSPDGEACIAVLNVPVTEAAKIAEAAEAAVVKPARPQAEPCT